MTEEEKKQVEKTFNITFQTVQRTEEIESSSRYVEKGDSIIANSNFILNEDNSYLNKHVSFILKGNILFTNRDSDLKSFSESVKKIANSPKYYNYGSQIWLTIFEIRIDMDADLLETIAHNTTAMSNKMRIKKDLGEDILLKITQYQETTIIIRENIVDKQRVIRSLLRSELFPKENYEELRVIIKDIHSLLEHTTFSFERLEYLQNTFLGLVNIEQNKIIKIFTVVSVVFMPPTLIASMYGMNFEFMPELKFRFGYLMAIALMIISSVLTLFIFKKRKWL